MAGKKPNPAMDFIVAQLKRNPKVSYADIKERATKKRLTIYPVMYGRAKLLLGMVSVSKRRSGKKKASKRGPGRPRKVTGRGPGRPRKTGSRGRPRSASAQITAVQDLVATVEKHARENADMRDALIKIRALIDRVV